MLECEDVGSKEMDNLSLTSVESSLEDGGSHNVLVLKLSTLWTIILEIRTIDNLSIKFDYTK